jgi:hypothetical protein
MEVKLMGRGRKKESRSKLAGKRLLIAKEIFGKSYEKLVQDRRWEKIVKIYSSKTVRDWVQNGIPINRVAAVARYFAVTGNVFTDAGIDRRAFEKNIFLSISKMDQY